MLEREITDALFNRVVQMVSATGPLPNYRVAWANSSFLPPNGKYLRVYNLIGAPVRQDIQRGRYHNVTGIMQIGLMIPEGGGDGKREASIIIDYFPPDLTMVENGTVVRITRRADLGTFLKGSPHWELPINVHWECKAVTE